MILIEDMQKNLLKVYFFVELKGKGVAELTGEIAAKLEMKGFEPHLRAEGVAFMPFKQVGTAKLPDIRVSISGKRVIFSVNFPSDLNEVNASVVGVTVLEAYEMIMAGVNVVKEVLDRNRDKFRYIASTQ